MSGPAAEREQLDLRLVGPAVAAWLVAWQVRSLPPWPVLLGAVALVVLAGVLLLGESERAALVAAVCLCAAAAAVATATRSEARTGGPLPDLAARGAPVVLEGVLTDDPRRAVSSAPGRPPLVIVSLRAEVLEAAGTTTRLRTPVLALVDDAGWLDLLPSQRVRVAGDLAAAEPGDDVAAIVFARGPPDVLSPPSRVQRVAGHLRAGLRSAVAPLPDAAGGLLPGLVVGDTSTLDPAVREDFRTVGLTHLTAVSGTNVAVVLAAVLALSRVLRLGLRAGPVLGGLGLLAFVVLARPSPSVLRAGAMGVIALVALATGGRRRAVPALAAAVLVLVLVAPDLAASPGFALSVLATAGLLVLGPALRDALARRCPGWLADALAVPLAAQLACGPVVVALSGELGLLSVPANLLAALAVPPATVLGVAVALLAPISLPLAQLLAWVAYLPAAWLVGIARVGSALPGAALPWPDGGRGALLLAAVSLALHPLLTRPRLRRVTLTVTTAVLMTCAGLRLGVPGWPPAGWVAVMCDVGQGDALVIRTGDSAALVVDAGPDPDLVDGCLDRLGVESVPMVVLSHPHADHVDGLPGVLRGRQVAGVEVGPRDDPPAQAAEVLQQAEAAGIPVSRGGLGEQREAGGVTWEVIGPRRTYRGSGSDPNNESLVLRVRTHGITMLLAGDVEPEAQADLVASGTDLRATVLKTPHHGSDHQHPPFLAAVGASVVVTGVGAGNTYGHPSADTLGQLTSQGARSYRTDLDGDIALVVRDGRLEVVGSRGAGTSG